MPKAVGSEAERLAAGSAVVRQGSRLPLPDSPDGRRLRDAACVFRGARNAQMDAQFEALSRSARVMHASPRCELTHPAGAIVCEVCRVSVRAQNV
eukprot:2389127-Alexandrium_andersonii.AAC.1